MMTRKDYVTTAEILNGNRPFITEVVFIEMVNEFAEYFAKDNPRFDYDKFYWACNGGK